MRIIRVASLILLATVAAPASAERGRAGEHDKDATIGLVVNSRGGTSIDEWLARGEIYWSTRRRAREAAKLGTLKGVIWHQGEIPNCTVVAHAYWWRQLANGTCDRQLTEHPNLYADMSGQVVVNVLNRDREYAREFIIRHQDKLLWATDEGWWSFGNSDRQMNQHYTFFEELDLPDEVRRKIYRENAIKIYGLK